MKAIIFSHDRGGSYVMDREGCFHFVKGYTSHPIGAEIELKLQAVPNLKKIRRIAAFAACFLVVLSLGYFTLMWNFISGDIGQSNEFFFIADDIPLSRAPPVSRSTVNNSDVPAVSAETATELIIFRRVTITVTDNHGTYTEDFRELNRSSEAIYTIEGETGIYTVYITFSENKVETAEIINFESP